MAVTTRSSAQKRTSSQTTAVTSDNHNTSSTSASASASTSTSTSTSPTTVKSAATYASNSASRNRALLLVLIAYITALIAAIISITFLPSSYGNPIIRALFGDIIATIIIWLFSIITDNSSMYDPYWSVQVPFVAIYFWYTSDVAMASRFILVITLVLIWSIRLTYNWMIGWRGLEHEDWRYVDIRGWSGRMYWIVSLLGIQLFPTIQVFLGCLPLHVALLSPSSLTPLDVVATIITIIAITFETYGDSQLREFINSHDWYPGSICDVGLWKYSRHPNYFGEVLFWWGILLFGIAANTDGTPLYWWHCIGAITITTMFIGISIPLLETRSLARRPEYKVHQQRVSMFIPWFPRK